MKKKILYTLTALLTASTTLIARQETSPPALASLVEAERSFAKTSVEKGVRDSFLMFFADDGINFQPHPVVTRQAFLKQPAPPQRPPVTLNWAPVFGDVAAAGDLGFTTGPYVFSDDGQKQPPRFGFYFSVWKKQPDGVWKVVIDAGVPTPTLGVALNSAFHPSDRVRSAKRVEMTSIEAGRGSLVEADRRLLEAAKSDGLATAMAEVATDDSRLHRSGRLPMIGKPAIRSYFTEKPYAILWEPIRADVSTSGDLGYSYGKYEMKTDPPEQGYYVRVWVRSGDSKWRLALDTTTQ